MGELNSPGIRWLTKDTYPEIESSPGPGDEPRPPPEVIGQHHPAYEHLIPPAEPGLWWLGSEQPVVVTLSDCSVEIWDAE
eukprot:4185031-Pyramimonas_sp.AAC.1